MTALNLELQLPKPWPLETIMNFVNW